MIDILSTLSIDSVELIIFQKKNIKQSKFWKFSNFDTNMIYFSHIVKSLLLYFYKLFTFSYKKSTIYILII